MADRSPTSFEDSRRLTGPNLYFAEPGAVLGTVGPGADDPRTHAAWAERVQRGRVALGWPDGPLRARPHPGGATLALAAPVDQLFTATELNEWAWLASHGEASFHAPGHPASWDEDAALRTLRAHGAGERRPALMALLEAAATRTLPGLLDDEALSLGLGVGSRCWPLAELPEPGAVPWAELHAVPTALVTGSNGKTTTVRLVAAMLRAHGLRAAHSCTDGLFFEGEALASGDYSGPAGARTLLRHPQVEAAVLETARGGILRRGLALARADVAVVTNISADHYGEYGIYDLAGLAEAKLAVARALDGRGTLVLNADDAMLCALGPGRAARQAWFALDYDHPLLATQRASGGQCCGVRDGRLMLAAAGSEHDLGAIVDLPLAIGGHARYNLGNAAAAALAATALGVPAGTIAKVLGQFGSEAGDNPGRLQRWQLGDVPVLMDYAHNPEGLAGLLGIAQSLRTGRLGLLLGQAGNREDAEVRALAGTAADFHPDLVVLKDIDGFLRGRKPGEVAAVLRDELLRRGLAETALPVRLREAEAAREALAWARPGDVLVLPVHALTARADVAALLDRLQACGWQPGQALPA